MPASAIFTAASADVAMAPEDKPGEAPSPVAMTGASPERPADACGGSARTWATRLHRFQPRQRKGPILGHLHGNAAGRLAVRLPMRFWSILKSTFLDGGEPESQTSR